MQKSLCLIVLMVLLAGCVSSGQNSTGIQSNSNSDKLFWDKEIDTIAERFELAKRSYPELIAFLRRMPKGGDLHFHLDGSSFSEYMLFNARDKGLNYNILTNQFTENAVIDNEIISIQDILDKQKYLTQYLANYSIRGWFPEQQHGRDHFFSVFPLVPSAQRSLNDMLAEVYARNRIENVQYIEAIAPTVPESVRRRFLESLTTFDVNNLEEAFQKIEFLIEDKKNIEEIRAFLDKREQEVDEKLKLQSSVTGNQSALTVRYLPYLRRVVSYRDFFIDAVSNIISVNNDKRVVAMNIVAPEDHPSSLEYFEGQMKILDFLWRKMEQPDFTLHAGELVLRDSPVEPMWSRIRETIEIGHARRIGHGVSIGWERDIAGLLDDMADNDVLVEVCLTSNESILDVSGDQHPFALYRRAGVPVALATDDEAVNRATLSVEFSKAVQRYQLNYQEVKELVRNSIEYSFLKGESLFEGHDYQVLQKDFEDIEKVDWIASDTARTRMQENEKLNRQVILERAFVQFEQSLKNGFREDMSISFELPK